MLIIFDAVIFIYGVYTIYSSIKMKQTGELSNFFTGGNMDPIRDVRGYIDYIYGKSIVLGAVAVVFGVVGVINDYIMQISPIMNAMVVLFLTVVVWFSITINRAKSRFW